MPNILPYLVPRRVTVPLFEHQNSAVVGYILFLLLLSSTYKALKTKNRAWKQASLFLFIALAGLILTNLWIENLIPLR